MKLVEGWLCEWQRLTCSHHWVRARWDDGRYGLRCSHCMKPYRNTWEDIIGAPAPTARKPPAAVPRLTPVLAPAPAAAAGDRIEFPAWRRAA